MAQSSICWLKTTSSEWFWTFHDWWYKRRLKTLVSQKPCISKWFKNCMKYVENVGDRSEEKGKLQVMTCITDPYGNPYIPGSSLKGMLRTILLSRDILQNREKYRTDTRQIRSDLEVNRINRRILNNNIVKIEKNAFNSVRSSGKKLLISILCQVLSLETANPCPEKILFCVRNGNSTQMVHTKHWIFCESA